MAIEAARLFVKVGSDTREGEAGLNSFNQRMNASARQLTMTGGLLTGAVTLPLLGIAKAGLDSAMGFEQSMDILQQVAGATAGEMQGLQAEALRLGAVTSFSAGEAATGMLELAKAGMTTEQVMASIGGVMDLAAAGGVGLAEAAGLTAATLNAFHLEASESARVADLLAAAANASAANISDLGAGMQQAGFAFSLANQPVENLAASLAILTNVGLTGSDAGTALKNAFMRLMNPTVEATGVMNELGISFYDTQGNMKALPDIIDMLNSATSGLTNEQRDAALATIFLSDGMKAMIPLMDAGKDGFNEMVDSVTEAGAATDVANARMRGLAGGIEYFKGSVDSFLIGAALPFLDTLGGLARGAGDALSAFGALPQPVINATLAFLGVMAAAGPLIAGLGALAGALAFLLSPIGLVVAATAVLAAAWAADIGGIQGITATAMGEAQAWFASTATAAEDLASKISTAFANTSFPSLDALWADFQAGDFEALSSKITSTAYELMVNLDTELNITATANDLKTKLVDAVNGLMTAASSLDFSGTAAGFDTLRDTIQSNLTTAIEGIDFGPAQSALTTAATMVSSGLSSLVTAAQGFDLGSAITNVTTAMGEVRDGILSGLTTAISGVDWAGGGSTFAGMIDGLSGAIESIDLSAIDWSAFLSGKILGPLGTAINAISWVMESEQFGGLVTSVTTAISSIDWGAIAGSLAGLGAAIATEIDALFLNIVSDATASINSVDWSQASIDTATMVSSWTASINSTDWSAVGANAVTGAKDAISSAMAGLSAIMAGETSVTDAFQAAVTNAFGSIQWGELDTALTGLAESVRSAITNVLGGIVVQLSTELSAITIPTPQWVTDITTWNPTTPQWVTSLQTWGSESMSAISEFDWADYITALLWPTEQVDSFLWNTWVTALTWPLTTINSFGWDTWLDALTWPMTAIDAFSWDTWVDALTWPLSAIGDFDWGSFIPDLSWPSNIFNFDWGDFINPFSAPSFPDSPGVDSGGSIGQGFSWAAPIPGNSGSRIFTNRESMAITRGSNSQGSVVIQITGPITIANDMDIEMLANKLATRFKQKMR